MSAATSYPVGGGAAVAGEYQALLGLPGITEAQVRRAVRYNPALRAALRTALQTLPEVNAAAPDAALAHAAELSRGADGQKRTGELYALLSPAAQARVVRGLDLPATCKTWKQIASRTAAYGTELLCNTLIVGENNYEALAQRPEQLAQVEQRFAQLSEAGRVKIVAACTPFGEAAASWDLVLRHAVSRSEVAELTAAIERQRAAEAKAAAKVKEPLLDTPHVTKPDPHKKRASKNLYKRRSSAGKA